MNAIKPREGGVTSIFLFRERQRKLPNERPQGRLDREMAPVAEQYITPKSTMQGEISGFGG